jgi:DNA-binding transcriptional LysR family regulator
MDIRYLRSFLLLSEHLHFGRASQAANVSQPALSLQIRNLEEELGVQLFLRDRRNTSLTPAGRVFIEQAREIVRLAEKSVTSLRRTTEGEIGLLRIGFISTAAALLVPPLVLGFSRKYPGVSLDLRNILTSDQAAQLADRRLDIGLLRVPLSTPPSIRLRVLHREPFVLLIPKSHPLAKNKSIQLRQLKGADFVMYTRRMAPGFHDQILTQLHIKGVTPHIVQEAGEMFTLLSLVAAGMGVAIAPESILLHSNKGIVSHRLPKEFGASEIAIAYNEENCSPSAKLFLAMAENIFPLAGLRPEHFLS